MDGKTMAILEHLGIYNGNYIGRTTDGFRKRKRPRPIVRKAAKIAVAGTFHEVDPFLGRSTLSLELFHFQRSIPDSTNLAGGSSRCR